MQNSLITCLQTPQGYVKEFSFPTTAIFVIFFSPSYIALNIATLSAQTVGVYDAFSILQPPYILPESVNTDAPTLKFE